MPEKPKDPAWERFVSGPGEIEFGEPLFPTEDVEAFYENAKVIDAKNPALNPTHNGHDHTLLPLKLYDGVTLFPTEEEIDARIHAELEAWAKFQKARYGKANPRPFEHAVTPYYMQWAGIDRLDLITDINQIRHALTTIPDDEAIKTIDAYRRKSRSILTRYWNNDTAITETFGAMTDLITQQFTQAFKKGVSRAGSNYNELEPEEQAVLTDLISEEKTHVFDLLNYVGDQKSRGGNLASVRNRIELWMARYDRVEERAYLIASRDIKKKWFFDKRKEHCRSCEALNGQVRKASFWVKVGIEPRSPRLECFGSHCGCFVIDTDEPISKGRLPMVGWRS